jgi:hypothetical protein
VLNRIPHVRGVNLEEGHELVKHDVAAIVSYPLKPTGKRKTAEESEDETDDTPKPGPSKKKQKTEGKILPKDNPTDRKYSYGNIPPLLKDLILKHLEKKNLRKTMKN